MEATTIYKFFHTTEKGKCEAYITPYTIAYETDTAYIIKGNNKTIRKSEIDSISSCNDITYEMYSLSSDPATFIANVKKTKDAYQEERRNQLCDQIEHYTEALKKANEELTILVATHRKAVEALENISIADNSGN